MKGFRIAIRVKLDEHGRGYFTPKMCKIAKRVGMPLGGVLNVRITHGSGTIRIGNMRFGAGAVWGGPTEQYDGGDTAHIYDGKANGVTTVVVTDP